MKLNILIVSVILVLGSCRAPEPASRPELLVAAASDLVRALPDLAEDFHARSGLRMRISYGSSGMLTQQILHGAPFHVFLSADRQYVEQLARAGKVAGGRRVYARGRLAVWSRDMPVNNLEDLGGSRVTRVALANPDHAPYGRAARQALEHSSLWTPLQSKLVLAETIRQSLEMAESGNVEAAFTAFSLLTPGAGHHFLVPEGLYEPLDQEAAVVLAGGNAERFLEYLGSEPAQKILGKFGFLLPK